MWCCEMVQSIYVSVASSQGEPQDGNLCALLEWVQPNEDRQAQDCTH